MAGRGTNAALGTLLVIALLTGIVSFGIGTSVGRWSVVVHGAAGLAIVLLVPWKAVIARRGLARNRVGRLESIALAVLVTVTVVSGVLFSTGLALRYGPLNAMQVHVGSAVLSLPLAIRHMRIRPVRFRSVDLDRRTALRAGALAAAAAVTWLGLEGIMRAARFPGGERRFTGSHERGSFNPAAMPATQWINDKAPDTDPATWRLVLRVSDEEKTVGIDDLEATDQVTAILDCTSGWWSEQTWSGVRLDRLLGDAPGQSILVRSATGYTRRFPRVDAANLLLATHIGGEPISRRHGAPARLVAPGRRGFWWVKWVTSIEVDDRPAWWQSPFPLT